MKVQLLTFPGCPHAEPARVQLQRVLRGLGVSATVEEIDVTAVDTPPALRGWASPTILIDGEDLEGLTAGDGQSCRLYSGGAPTEELIQEVVRRRTAVP